MDKHLHEGLSSGVRAVHRPVSEALDAGGLSPSKTTSPVTYLARNLSGQLSSGGNGTPRRRIYWSSNENTPKELGKLRKSRLFLGRNMADSPQIPDQQDSPVFQDTNDSRLIRRGRALPQSSRPQLQETCGKEKIPRCQQGQEEDGSLRSPLKSISNHQSIVCLNTAGSPFRAESDDKEDGFSIFDMDALDSDASSSINDFHRLLKDPLSSRYQDHMEQFSGSDLIGADSHPAFYCADSPSKLRIRRCLSMIEESPVAGPFLSPGQELLEFGNKFRRPENTRKRLLQDVEELCEPSSCMSDHRAHETKRRKSSSLSHSETDTISRALQISTDSSHLIGDCSGSYALPLVKSKHDDLKGITCTTLSNLMNGMYEDSVDQYQIVDCRYPYEFDGGHIKGACNLYTQESILENLIDRQAQPSSCKKRSILVFHCEFSSERGPKLSRFLRNKDREANEGNYPNLFHPEIYLLEGGYRDFFEHHKELCVPQDYLPMLSKDHKSDLKKFRSKSKSWSRIKSRVAVRPGLKL